MSKKYLLDVNVLAALTTDEHEHYHKAHRWFDRLAGFEWAVCPLTETGYMRLAANPATRVGSGSIKRASDVLAEIARLPGYRYWPMIDTWAELTTPFRDRILGHRQITDAYLLGLAIKENGVLVTFDRGFKYLAGPQFTKNLLILE